MCMNERMRCTRFMYGVATVSRIDQIIGLFCKRDLQKRQYSAKETYNLIDLTDRSHPIVRVSHRDSRKEHLEYTGVDELRA